LAALYQSGNLRGKSLLLSRIVREGGLRRQHLKEATQAAQERDFARDAIFMGLRATQLGEQLHLVVFLLFRLKFFP
jgi:hypothetical protein